MSKPMTRARIACLALILVAASPLGRPAQADLTKGPPEEKACLAAIGAAAPIGTTGCPGVRPGALIEIPKMGAFCTLGFLYKNSSGKYLMTTAGHCILGEDNTESKVWPTGTGPTVLNSAGKKIGRFVYASFADFNPDIGIIELSAGVKPSAQVCHFGGPTGVSTSKTKDTVQLGLYGNGLGIGDALPARTLVALGMRDPSDIPVVGPSSPGDSGGPVVISKSGGAVGYVVAFGAAYDLRDAAHPTAGYIFINRLGPQIAKAAAALKTKLYLKTAKKL